MATAEIVGLDSFLFQFHDKSTEAHKKGADCFKAADYMGYMACYLEEGYFLSLSQAVRGDDHEKWVDAKGQPRTVVDMLRDKLKAEQPNQSRITQVIKKMGKLEKLPEIEEAIKRFIDEVSDDFMALSKKSTEIYHVLDNMGTWEKMEKGLTHNVKEKFTPDTKLFMEDKDAMAIMERLKTPETINQLIKEIQKILS
jgi:hypothetical protein